MLLRLFICVFLTVLPGIAPAQAPRPVPAEAADPLREANRQLDIIRASNLDAGWRATALARMARTLARTGDAEAARVAARDAILATQEPVRSAPPPGLSPGAVYGVLAQTYADLRDPAAVQSVAELAAGALKALGDPAAQATLFPLVALGLADINNRDAASMLVLEALRAAARAPAGRERVAGLSLAGIVQARIGDAESARETVQAARADLNSISVPSHRALALGQVARAEAATGNRDAARTLSREGALAYDRAQGDVQFDIPQRVATLAAIALAQAESGDRNAARQTMRAARQTADRSQGTYERFQSMLVLADTVLQVERGP